MTATFEPGGVLVKHAGAIAAVVLVLAGAPVGIGLADYASRIAYSSGYGISPTNAGPLGVDTAGARIFRAGVRGDLSEIPRSVRRVSAEKLTMAGCSRCHGTWGRGGPVPVPWGSAYAPPITYADLVLSGYTEETIGVAIRSGVDAHGRQLSELMPRWDLDDEELVELIPHLKAIGLQ